MKSGNWWRRFPAWVSESISMTGSSFVGFSLAALVALVLTLAVLQYRWIGEISEAESVRLRATLETGLNAVSRDFRSVLSQEALALQPTDDAVASMGMEAAYAERFRLWSASSEHPKLFRVVALLHPGAKQLPRLLDPASLTFEPVPWPAGWEPLAEYAAAVADAARTNDPSPRGGPRLEGTTLIELPRFPTPPDSPENGPEDSPEDPFEPERASGPPVPPRELNWLILDLDPDYAAQFLIPEVLRDSLGQDYAEAYRVQISDFAAPGSILFTSVPDEPPLTLAKADAATRLFEPPRQRRGRDGDRDFEREEDDRERYFENVREVIRDDILEQTSGDRRPPEGGFRRDGERGRELGRGRWLMLAQSTSGSLETVVEWARLRNSAISGAVLLLLLGTGFALVRFAEQKQRLAALEMDFVAGVSHELRTPLTVIRTAAFNLRGRMAADPSQVQRYGNLIQEESEKLTGIVEQVLSFSGARAGRAVRERHPVEMDQVIEAALKASRSVLEENRCEVEVQVEPGLPPVLGDTMALTHAFQNLLQNAAKYGGDHLRWVGIFAQAVEGRHGPAVEVHVSDRGVGIPADEIKYIFDAFFRGNKAVRDQIHGTGLGLHLVKQVIEAHGGSISVDSEAGVGTTFHISLPAMDHPTPAGSAPMADFIQ